MIFEKLKVEADEARDRCRLTKSTVRVGCAILSTDYKIYTGCNFDLEFGVTIHAETCAIANLVANSTSTDEKIKAVLIYSDRDFTPCGSCRDQIRFMATPDVEIYSYNEKTDISKLFTIDDLLPHYPTR
jgi:cytidine deaminase